MKKLFIVTFLSFSILYGHDGHEEGLQSWTQWIGGFHLIFLHFPLALIPMTAVSEVLFTVYRRPIYDDASRFMLTAAAILAIPTALLGLIYRTTADYDGLLAQFVWWHQWLGIATAVLACFAVYLRERTGRGALYIASLVLLFLLVNITGFFGGGLTFGPDRMYPPI